MGFACQPSPLPFQGTQWSLPTQNLSSNPTLEPDLLLLFFTNLVSSHLTLSSARLRKRRSEVKLQAGSKDQLFRVPMGPGLYLHLAGLRIGGVWNSPRKGRHATERLREDEAWGLGT